MGGGDNEITIDANLDAKGFESGTKQIEDAIESLGNTIERVFTMVTEFINNLDFQAVGDALKNGDWAVAGQYIKEAVNAAKEAASVETDIGENVGGGEQIKENASALREYEQAAKRVVASASKIGDAFKKSLDGAESAVKKASNGLRSLFRNAERGANVAGASFKRMAGLVIGATGAYQILSKAVNAFMSQNQELSARISSIWTALGNVLGPIITQIINWVTTAVSYFLEFLRILGLTGKTASQLSKAANKAGGELKKTIAGFDELNLLNGGGGGGGPNGGLSDVDLEGWMAKLAELLKNKMWDDAADLIIQKINALIAKFKANAERLGEKIGEYLSGIVHVIARVLDEIDWKGLGEALGKFFMGLTEKLDGKDLGKILVAKFTIAIKMLTGFLSTEGLGERIASILSGAFIGALESLGNAIRNADWKAIGTNIREFFGKLWEDKDAIANAIFEVIEAAWNAFLDLLWGLISEDTEEEPPLVASLRSLGESIKSFSEDMAPLLEAVWNDILKPFGEWVINSGLPAAIDLVSAALKLLGEALGGLYEVVNGNKPLSEYFTDLESAAKTLKDALFGAADSQEDLAGRSNSLASILGTFVPGIGPVINAFNGLKDIFSGSGQEADTAGESVAGFNETASDTDGVDDATESVEKLDETMGNLSKHSKTSATSTKKEFDTMSTGVQDAVGDAADYIETDFPDAVDTGLSAASAEAGWWGTDMVDNFIKGALAERASLGDALAQIAQMIKDYLGFSEPDKGPLANFHTFGPDMMDLYASGIAGNKKKVLDAVGDVASGVSDALEGGEFDPIKVGVNDLEFSMDGFADKIVAGFENLIERLQAIADNVVFSMPDVAGGGIVPYGVGGVQGFGMPGENQNNNELMSQLIELISEFRDSVEHMQWVAKFGKLDAVVQEVTRIQKQNERARG